MKKLIFSMLSLVCMKLSIAQPAITSFNPAHGPAGTIVTIAGTNFSSTLQGNVVFFGAMKANVLTANSDTLTVIVPTGATYDRISLSTNGLTCFSNKPFTLTIPNGYISDNSFVPEINLPSTSFRPLNIKIADLDGDGKNDLVVANRDTGSVSIFKNNSSLSTMSFSNVLTLKGLEPYYVTVGDLNSDGRPDIVVSNYYDRVLGIYKNISTPGNIVMSPVQNITVGDGPDAAAIDDFDGDGRTDIVSSNYYNHTLSVLRNSGSGETISFDTPIDLASHQPYSVKSGDLDGDGKPEIIVPNYYDGTVAIWKNNCTPGTLSFGSRIDVAAGLSPISLAIGDLNGDNKTDLIVGNSGQIIVTILQNIGDPGTIHFDSRPINTGGRNPLDIQIADIDGDAQPDLAVTNNFDGSIGLLPNQSDRTHLRFPSAVLYNAGIANQSFPESSALGDLNGDGKMDLVVPVSHLSYAGYISIFSNRIIDTFLISFTPTSATTGDTVTITGSNFENVTSVVFGGQLPQSFEVVSSSKIKAVVGDGGSGKITVTDLHGVFSRSGFVYLDPGAIVNILCPAQGIGLPAHVSGTSYQWEVDNGLGYEPVVDNNYYSGATTDSLFILIPATPNISQYRCRVTTNNVTTFSNVYLLRFAYLWTGVFDNNWNNPLNWTCGVPVDNSDVIINGGNVILSFSTTIRTLTVGPNATFTVAPGVNLTVTHQ